MLLWNAQITVGDAQVTMSALTVTQVINSMRRLVNANNNAKKTNSTITPQIHVNHAQVLAVLHAMLMVNVHLADRITTSTLLKTRSLPV